MQDYSKQWNEYRALLKQWRLYHREFAPQIIHVQKHFDKLELECSRHLIEYRRTKRPHYLQKADETLAEAAKQIKLLSRFEFLASLSK